jgi:hypothetical protein
MVYLYSLKLPHNLWKFNLKCKLRDRAKPPMIPEAKPGETLAVEGQRFETNCFAKFPVNKYFIIYQVLKKTKQN